MNKTIKTTLLLFGVGILAFILGMKAQSFLYDDICLDMGGGKNPGGYDICVIEKGDGDLNSTDHYLDLTDQDLETKDLCEERGGEWIPVGKLQKLACIYTYGDAGELCSSSNQCQGDCIVTEIDGSDPQCAENNNKFGCRSTIEEFKKSGGIMCID